MKLKGSKTEANLMTAFSGECMARVKYEIYAEKLRAEGFEEFARKIESIAENEKRHARAIMRAVCGGGNSAAEAATDAQEGENYEFEEMYPTFSRTAKEEGFDEIAQLFEALSEVESNHAEQFREMADVILEGSAFERNSPVEWQCLRCGMVRSGIAPPSVCAICGATKGEHCERKQ